jgi:hypothetical protein
MKENHSKKSNFNAIACVIILVLISAISFLLKLNNSGQLKNKSIAEKKSDSSTSPVIFQDNSSFDLYKYRDENNQLVKVDTSIKPLKNSDYKYANTTNHFKTYFKDKIETDKMNVKIERDNSSVTFEVINRLRISEINDKGEENIIDEVDQNNINSKNIRFVQSPDHQNNRVRYSKIYEKNDAYIDVDYSVENNRLHEEFIVNKYLGIPKIIQKVNLSNAYIKVADSKINIYQKKTNKLLWFIPQPIMYEQVNQKNISEGIRIELQCLDGKAINQCENILFIKTITEEGRKWLSDPSRTYPVVIDPEFQIDNADDATRWISSDPYNTIVSQETLIKQEGTAAVKVTGNTTYAAWSTDGYTADSGCVNGSTIEYGIYTSCGSPSICSYAGWNYSTCDYSSYTTTLRFSTCSALDCGYGNYSYYVGGDFTGYSGTGSCIDGVTPCYRLTGPVSGYSGGSSCGSSDCLGYGTYYTGVSSCYWEDDEYLYPAQNLQNKFRAGGTNCTNGVDPCYKLTNSYTGYVNSSCGGSNCGNTGTYYDRVNCTWIDAGSWNDTITLYKNPPNNLSQASSITFWVQANQTGSIIQFQMGEQSSDEQVFNFTINAANTWEQKTWDLSSIPISSRDSITQFAFKVIGTNSLVFYFDDIKSHTIFPPTNCVISESSNDSFLLPQWTDNSSDEDGFRLEKSTDNANYEIIANLAAGTTGYQDSDVQPGHLYSYRVRAYKPGIGITDYSDYCLHPKLDLQKDSIKFEGSKIDGIKIN